MTKKEQAEKNIGTTFDFVRHVVEHPDILDTLADGAELDFIDKDMPSKGKHPKGKKVARYRVERVFEPIKG